MKLLITGGLGFIGSHVVRAAVKQGHNVLNLDLETYAACPKNLEDVSGLENYTHAKIDLRDHDAVIELVADYQPDGIMHLAAESHVDRSISGPAEFIETNIVGTFNLLEAARHIFEKSKPDLRFLHVSTDEVYGSLGSTGSFEETTPYAPNSPYSASKASSDHLARAWFETYNLPVLISNCSNNYGPNQFPEKLIPVIILNALSGQKIPIYGDGQNVRDWLFVTDHVDALLQIFRDGVPGEKYNIGGGAEVSNLDLAQKICGILDDMRPGKQSYENQIQFVTDRPGHDFRYAINSSKIKAELGWTPNVTLDEGLKLTVEWYLENLEWVNSVKELNSP